MVAWWNITIFTSLIILYNFNVIIIYLLLYSPLHSEHYDTTGPSTSGALRTPPPETWWMTRRRAQFLLHNRQMRRCWSQTSPADMKLPCISYHSHIYTLMMWLNACQIHMFAKAVIRVISGARYTSGQSNKVAKSNFYASFGSEDHITDDAWGRTSPSISMSYTTEGVMWLPTTIPRNGIRTRWQVFHAVTEALVPSRHRSSKSDDNSAFAQSGPWSDRTMTVR